MSPVGMAEGVQSSKRGGCRSLVILDIPTILFPMLLLLLLSRLDLLECRQSM